MVILLLPLVAAILLCYHTGQPVNLLHESECETLDSLHTYAFVLQGDPKSTTHCERFEAHMLARWDTTDQAWCSTQGRILLYVQRDSIVPQPGDTLIAQTRIRRGGMIGTFDYGTYLRRQGIIGTAYVRRFTLQPASTPPSISLQKRLYQRLAAAGLHEDEKAIVGALTLGYKEDLDPEIKHRFQASGAAHVLAVSGLHTGILYGLLILLFTLGGRIRPMYENRLGRCTLSLLIIAVMGGYAWLTGLTPSVVRAVLMVSLVEFGRMMYRNSLSINTIAAAAVLILLARPLDLWSVSFQLSFAATAAIVLFTRKIPKNWFIATILISLAAQLGTMPITMYTYGQFSSYFLLTNLIVLPLATVLVPLGLLTIALGGTSIGCFVGQGTEAVAWLMNHSVGWIESLPGSTVSASVNGPMIAVYYALLLLFCVFILKKAK
ncbi:MAG: ComEC/Rec2 family competence protein [Paludibacteraceae bacterium]|nr:ComEC/Rec2 family competence protein [Paludibacteraceae bacterium]